MTARESLRLYGTITLSKEFLEDMIGFGDLIYEDSCFKGFSGEGDLNPTLWLKVVPATYRALAQETLSQIKITPETKETDLGFLSQRLEEKLKHHVPSFYSHFI